MQAAADREFDFLSKMSKEGYFLVDARNLRMDAFANAKTNYQPGDAVIVKGLDTLEDEAEIKKNIDDQ